MYVTLGPARLVTLRYLREPVRLCLPASEVRRLREMLAPFTLVRPGRRPHLLAGEEAIIDQIVCSHARSASCSSRESNPRVGHHWSAGSSMNTCGIHVASEVCDESVSLYLLLFGLASQFACRLRPKLHVCEASCQNAHRCKKRIAWCPLHNSSHVSQLLANSHDFVFTMHRMVLYTHLLLSANEVTVMLRD